MVMASTVTATDQRLAAGSDSGGFWDYRTSRAVRRWRHILRLRSRITIENIWRVTPGVEEDYDTGGDVWSLTNWSKLLLTNLWVVEVHYGYCRRQVIKCPWVLLSVHCECDRFFLSHNRLILWIHEETWDNVKYIYSTTFVFITLHTSYFANYCNCNRNM